MLPSAEPGNQPFLGSLEAPANCIPPEALPSVPAGIVKADPSLENLESSPPSG